MCTSSEISMLSTMAEHPASVQFFPIFVLPAIAGNSAIAGSTKIGKNCTLAGCSAIVDNIEISDEVHITAMSLITKSIKESGYYSSGTPFMKNSDWKKNAVAFKRLHGLINK